jgi:hypothetical protein
MRALRKLKRDAGNAEYVFVSERGSPFSTAGYAKMVARAGEDAGFKFGSSKLRRYRFVDILAHASSTADQRAQAIEIARRKADAATQARQAECAIRGPRCRDDEAAERTALAEYEYWNPRQTSGPRRTRRALKL